MTTEADLTPPRLTGWLAAHTGGATVTAVQAETVGTGQMALCLRLLLDYDRPGAGPASVVAKLPSLDPASRAAAAALRCYEIEVNFYRELRADLAVHTPAVYHAEVDVADTDFLLLLEDVAPAHQGDQLTGCRPDEAAAAVEQLAGLHAPLWGDPRLERLEWLHRNTEERKGDIPGLVCSLYPGFVERYAGRLDPEVRAVADRLIAGLPAYTAARPGPWTVTHGDFRLDNLLFEQGGGGVWVVDWQTAVLGAGVSDLSYFLGSALPVEQRREHEGDLVRLYHGRLAAAGVHLGWDELWSQYRRYSFGGLIMAIAASMLVQRTARGDDMFMTMADRHGRHALDLGAADLLG
jgi:hypothetical protein